MAKVHIRKFNLQLLIDLKLVAHLSLFLNIALHIPATVRNHSNIIVALLLDIHSDFHWMLTCVLVGGGVMYGAITVWHRSCTSEYERTQWSRWESAWCWESQRHRFILSSACEQKNRWPRCRTSSPSPGSRGGTWGHGRKTLDVFLSSCLALIQQNYFGILKFIESKQNE